MEAIAYFNWVDLLVFIIMILSTYIGSQRGLFGELLYLLGLYIIAILSMRFSSPLSYFLNRYMFLPLNVCYVISFICIIGLLYFVFKRLYAFLLNIAKIEVFHSLNKIGGLLIGMMRGFVVSVLVSFALVLMPIQYISESVKIYSLSGNFLLNSGSTLYSKTVSLLTGKQDASVEHLLSSVEPAQFKILKIKRKNSIEEFLEK
ncbi:MAG: CvpA family protein [Candidatus Omnitrophica bacterium]|nr:CvpA family protein [Candidatus Omnitrophota bacterium]